MHAALFPMGGATTATVFWSSAKLLTCTDSSTTSRFVQIPCGPLLRSTNTSEARAFLEMIRGTFSACNRGFNVQKLYFFAVWSQLLGKSDLQEGIRYCVRRRGVLVNMTPHDWHSIDCSLEKHNCLIHPTADIPGPQMRE